MLPTLWRPFTSDIFEPFDVTDWTWPDEAFAEMDRMSREMSRQMNRMFRRLGVRDRGLLPAITYPPLDMWQDDECLYVEAELPGTEIDDLDISVTGGNQLSIRGERKPPTVEKGNCHRQERGYGQFSRLLTLPCEVKTEEVDAQLKDGVLTVKLPKCEAAKPRRLAIKAE